MLAGKISALKYFPNCFWDSVQKGFWLCIVRLCVYQNKKGLKKYFTASFCKP
jgi:hypothetical protein